MKTKAVRQPRKVTGIKPVTNPAPDKIRPGEDQIREKAIEIYYDRIARGEYGTAETDWYEAEELLKGS